MTSLLDKPLLILDGGLGTTLEDQQNITFSAATPLWSSHLLIDSPSTLLKVQSDFAQAGADIIITATYQASFHGFSNTRIVGGGGDGESASTTIGREEAKKYMLSAVDIARSAFKSGNRDGLVALSLGAYGATTVPSTEYSGDYGPHITESELLAFHQERLKVFADSDEESWSNIDIIAIETLPRLDEVRAAREMMTEMMQNASRNNKPYWIACVFPNHDDNLPDGSSIESLVNAMMLDGPNPPFAIGINCTKVHKVADLVRKFEQAAQSLHQELPRLAIYPDGAGGLVYDTVLQKWIGENQNKSKSKEWHEQVFEIVQDIQRRGKWKGLLVGGCCKTTPQHIEKLRRKFDSSI